MTHAQQEASPLDKVFTAAFGAVAAALTATYIMTVTDTKHIYERDFVRVVDDAGQQRIGEVCHVHSESNSLAVRLWRDSEPTNEILTAPAELVDLHPAGRPIGDDEPDGFENYSFDPESLDTEEEDN